MMEYSETPTKYAPAERLSEGEIRKQIQLFKNNETLDEFLGRIPAIFLILNEYRQIVYMNKGALDFTGLEDLTSIIGERPGEVFGCIHSNEEEGGCGTTEACTYCGAVNAVLTSQKRGSTTKDAHLVLGPDEKSYDLRIWASQMKLAGESFTAVTLQNIGHEKRRLALERIFFHDIMNILSALFGNLQMLVEYGDRLDQKEFIANAFSITQNLMEEIRSQQIFTAAENDDYTISLESINTTKLLEYVKKIYDKHTVAHGKSVKIDQNVVSVRFTTDLTLIRRILSNMVKNALEAVEEGQTITLSCAKQDDQIKFSVHNPGYIPREVQLQIFKRSFSTKSKNRGLGTYSMKLLSKYIQGEVFFTTSKKKGTQFILSCPMEWSNDGENESE